MRAGDWQEVDKPVKAVHLSPSPSMVGGEEKAEEGVDFQGQRRASLSSGGKQPVSSLYLPNQFCPLSGPIKQQDVIVDSMAAGEPLRSLSPG